MNNKWESPLDPKEKTEREKYIEKIRERARELLLQIPDEQVEFILSILQEGKTIKEIAQDESIENSFREKFNLEDDKNFREIANVITALKFADRENERLNGD